MDLLEKKKKHELKFGLIPDSKKKFAYKQTIIDRVLPNSFNILDYINKININEQLYNDCSANAIQKQIQIMGQLKNKFFNISVLYQYYNSRIINNNNNPIIDEGVSLEDAYHSLERFCFVDNMLYDYYNPVNAKPHSDCYIQAAFNRGIIIEFEKIQSTPSIIKFYLTKYRPIVCGIPIYENFLELSPTNFKLYNPFNIPNHDSRLSPCHRNILGYHAVLIVGYDHRGFIVLNSHGEQFGDHGFFILDEDYQIIDPYIINLI
jgi:hypothetical protein